MARCRALRNTNLKKILKLQNVHPTEVKLMTFHRFAAHSTTALPSTEALSVFFFRFCFSCVADPLSNVSAGTGLPATAKSARASARYHAQDGRHPGEASFCTLLAGVACVSCVSKNGVEDFEVK